MSSLANYITDVRMQNREAFMRLYPQPFLMLKLEDIGPPQGQSEDDWAGQTRTTKVLGKTGSFAVLRHNAALYRMFALVPKSSGAPDAGAALVSREQTDPDVPLKDIISSVVTIGRSDDNDIVIAEHAISKHHARFLCDGEHEWFLEDVGSRNGSSVNDRRVAPQSRVPVSFGDPILLGGLALMIIGAGALYEIVQAQMAQSGTPERKGPART